MGGQCVCAQALILLRLWILSISFSGVLIVERENSSGIMEAANRR
jgi:hypothetical protein